MAAAMHFFSMSTLESTPSTNALPVMVDKTPDEKWSAFKAILTRLVSRYVLVDSIANELKPPKPQDSQKPTLSDVVNPHKVRIAKEHNYSMTHQARIAAEHCYDGEANDKQQRQRCLPLWLRESADEVTTNYQVQKASPDGVFNYASAILNDGLLLLELRDAINDGYGPRIFRCWKFVTALETCRAYKIRLRDH